jgi:hypothetical protein
MKVLVNVTSVQRRLLEGAAAELWKEGRTKEM